MNLTFIQNKDLEIWLNQRQEIEIENLKEKVSELRGIVSNYQIVSEHTKKFYTQQSKLLAELAETQIKFEKCRA
jgi:SMC interacting uncharacterized protein involved in chromosome segregation